MGLPSPSSILFPLVSILYFENAPLSIRSLEVACIRVRHSSTILYSSDPSGNRFFTVTSLSDESAVVRAFIKILWVSLLSSLKEVVAAPIFFCWISHSFSNFLTRTSIFSPDAVNALSASRRRSAVSGPNPK